MNATRAAAVAVISLLFVAARTAAGQTPSSGLTLDAARAAAEAANPHLTAARLKRPIDAANIDLAAIRPNPELSYELGRDTPRHSFTVTLPVELGGKRGRRLDLAKAGAAVGNATFAAAVFAVQNDVRRAYFELAAADARMAAAADLRALAVRARDAAQARFTLGDVPRLEVLRAELEQASADNDLTAASSAVAAARAALNTLLGRTPDVPVTATDALTGRGLPPEQFAIERANTASAELAALDAAIAEQRARRALAQSSVSPDLAIGGGVTSGIPDEFAAGWRATAAVTIPLFARKAPVAVEDAALNQLLAERAATAADIVGRLAEARARAAAAEAQLDRYERDILPRALEVERMAEDAYRSGQSNLSTLLDALRSSRELRYRALDVALDYQLAIADVERAIGAVIK